MNTDSILSYLFEAKECLRNAKTAAAAEGIDGNFDDLINQVDLLDLHIFTVQTGQGDL